MEKTSNPITSEIVQLFSKGDERALRQVFDWLHAGLLFYAVSITKDQGEAEDIVSEAFAKVWSRRKMFNDARVLKSYLYTIVRNSSLNFLKQHTKQELAVAKLGTWKEGGDDLGLVAEAEMVNQLATELDTLSAQGKEVIRLLYWEGKKIREVAENLGISESTVKTQKMRAIQRLRTALSIRMEITILFVGICIGELLW
jgi:RNA polymerase sigma-70 factor (ECF subfamily)